MRGNVGSLKTSFQSGTSAGIYPETEDYVFIDFPLNFYKTKHKIKKNKNKKRDTFSQ